MYHCCLLVLVCSVHYVRINSLYEASSILQHHCTHKVLRFTDTHRWHDLRLRCSLPPKPYYLAYYIHPSISQGLPWSSLTPAVFTSQYTPQFNQPKAPSLQKTIRHNDTAHTPCVCPSTPDERIMVHLVFVLSKVVFGHHNLSGFLI